jgi:hypothetical protein
LTVAAAMISLSGMPHMMNFDVTFEINDAGGA